MRILAIIATLLLLSGCAGMEFVAVDYHHGYNHGPYFRPAGHTSYTLGYYSGSYYNGYTVYGSHGHRYYYAPQHYSHHRHFARPVVVQHVHVHTSYCEHTVRPRHNPRPRATPPPRTRQHIVPTQPRRDTRNDNRRRDASPPPRRRDATPPRTQPTRVTPPRQRQNVVQPQNERRVDRADRGQRGRDRNKKRN